MDNFAYFFAFYPKTKKEDASGIIISYKIILGFKGNKLLNQALDLI